MAGSALRPFLRTTGGLDALDVREYGAKFDNVTDDTAAIQAALNAAVRTGYGGYTGNNVPARPVLMPSGFAKVSSPLTIHANTWLMGCGAASTIIGYTGTGNCIELYDGSEVQCTLSDFGISITDNSAVGINLTFTGGASSLGDAAHRISNVIVIAGAQALHVEQVNEFRLDNFMAYRQVPGTEVGDGCVFLFATDMMIERVTVAQPQWLGAGVGRPAMDVRTSNTRFVDIKVFGGNATVDGQMGPGFQLIGQRNRIIGLEVQDYAGGWGCIDAGGWNSYTACIFDSCQGGGMGMAASPYAVYVTDTLFVNRGGAFTMPTALDLPNGAGSVVDVHNNGVAANFKVGQDGTGNYVRINGVLQPIATYTPSNVSTDRSYDANSTSLDELADVLGTLITDLQGRGFIS